MPFGPLGLVAQNEQRHAEHRRFLLHPARIAQHEVGARASRRASRRGRRGRAGDARDARRAARAWSRATWAIGMEHEADVGIAVAGERRGPPRRSRPSPSPQLSRRWQVTSKRGRAVRAPRAAGSRASAATVASMPLLPVTNTAPVTPSAARLAAAPSVGANSMVAARVDRACDSLPRARARRSRRCASPASTCATGTPRSNAACAAPSALEVSPWTAISEAAAAQMRRAARARTRGDMRVGLGQAGAIERRAAADAPSPYSAGSRSGCWPVRTMHGAMPARGERGGDGGQFDGFGPGPDDQPDFSAYAAFPLARPGEIASIMDEAQPDLAEVVGIGLDLEADRRPPGRRDSRSRACGNKSTAASSDREAQADLRLACRPSRSSRSAGRGAAARSARTRASTARRRRGPTGWCGVRPRGFARWSSPPRGGKARGANQARDHCGISTWPPKPKRIADSNWSA